MTNALNVKLNNPTEKGIENGAKQWPMAGGRASLKQ
jgi:hypothetical protein